MKTKLRCLALFMTSFILMQSFAFAQNEKHLLFDLPGKWSFEQMGDGYCDQLKLSGAEKKDFRLKLSNLAETVRRNSAVLTNLKGFDMVARLWLNCDYKFNQRNYNYGVSGLIDLTFRTFSKENGKISRWNIEPPQSEIQVNNSMAMRGGGFNYPSSDENMEMKETADKLNDLFVRMNVEKEIAPGIIYIQDGALIVANPERPPYWLPVKVKEVLDLLIKYYKADYNKNPNTLTKMMVNEVLKVYNSFSPSQLEMNAYNAGSSSENLTGISYSEGEGGFPVMRFNKDYYDRSLPRTAIQLISMRVSRTSNTDLEEMKSIGSGVYFQAVFENELELSSLGNLLMGFIEKK